MSRKIIRIIAILFGVFAAAEFLPQLYGVIAVSGSDYKRVIYSEVLQDFIISEFDYSTKKTKSKRLSSTAISRDTKGNYYDEQQVYELAPLENASQLAFDGNFPDSICGLAVTPAMVAAESFTVYYGDRGGVYYGLFDLKDRMSYTSKELQTKDLFAINELGIRFINVDRNVVDTAKTTLFNKVLFVSGFDYPARYMWTPGDRTDAEKLGYFIIDNEGELYRLSMVYGEPEVVSMENPEGKVVNNISFTDAEEFLAFVVTDDGMTYMMDREFNYKRMPLPDVAGCRVSMSANMLYRTFTYGRYGSTDYYVTDRDYNLVDSCSIPSRTYEETAKWRVQQAIFPLTISHTAWDGVIVKWSSVKCFIYLNIILLVLMIVYKKRCHERVLELFSLIDLLVVAVFGVFGFLGVLAMPTIRQKTVSKK